MPRKRNGSLFSKSTQAIIYGMQANAVQRMLDFDYTSRREKPSVACIVDKTSSGWHKVFFGREEILLPVYRNIAMAVDKHPKADVLINFASYRQAFKTSVEALEAPTIKTLIIIAEGVPEHKARILRRMAQEKHKWIIGPATVGGIRAGAFKIGNTGGTIENIVESKLHRPGSVGFVSKSGGMSNEMYNIIARNSDGIVEGIAIGGDRFPGSTLVEHLLRFQDDHDVRMMVMLGEVGGTDEYLVAEAMESGKLTKPIVAWVTGTCARHMPQGLQFGHAGALAEAKEETAEAKNLVLKQAGAVVPESFDDLGVRIKEVYENLKAHGEVEVFDEPQVPSLAPTYAEALKRKEVRKPASIICTISNDSGEELTYLGTQISQVINKNFSLGEVIGMLWLRKRLPDWAAEFVQKVLIITADHGPCVSGAHNAIVAARAGKDLVSSLASGLLTVGPRFGGAIDGAAKDFKKAFDQGWSPAEFVEKTNDAGKRIPGIGHRVKSAENPDMRVTLLKRYARRHFPDTQLLNYALKVEQTTLKKRNNLILNVDGCIGILMVDLLLGCGYEAEEVDTIIDNGTLNGLFVLGRSIGMIGHILDQKRQKAKLYRHPYDDVLFLDDMP